MSRTRFENITLSGVRAEAEKVADSPIFINEYFGMFYKAGIIRRNFMLEGQVYRMQQGSVTLVTEGTLDISVDLEDYHLEKGDVMITVPDVINEVRGASDDFNMIVFSFSEEIVVEDNLLLHTNAVGWRELLQLTDMLWSMVHRNPFRKKTVFSLITTIINDVEEIANENDRRNVNDKTSSAEIIFNRFKKLVNQYSDEHRTVGFYASQLYLSPNHLSNIINKASGETVMQWINRAVILKSKVLLTTSDMKGYEIAERLHFVDYATFSKFFKRETGMSPKKYVEMNMRNLTD